MRFWLAGALVVLLGVGGPATASGQKPAMAFVVAPGAVAQREARQMMRFCRWTDTSVLRDAEFVLVLVRTSDSRPLAPSYASLKWLRESASSQLDETGAQFHAYVYTIRSDLSLVQWSHRSFDANPTGTLTPTPTALPASDSTRGFFCG